MTMNEEITTIFVVGFPDDMREREFQNLFLFANDFEGAVLKVPSSFSLNPASASASYPHHAMSFAGTLGSSYSAAPSSAATMATTSASSSSSTNASTPVAHHHHHSHPHPPLHPHHHAQTPSTGAGPLHHASLPLSATPICKTSELHDTNLVPDDMVKEACQSNENQDAQPIAAPTALADNNTTPSPLYSLHSASSSHASSTTSLPMNLKKPAHASTPATLAAAALSGSSPQASTPHLSHMASPAAPIPTTHVNQVTTAPYSSLMGQPGLPRKQIIGFARFKTQAAALQAIDVISGKKIDPERCSLMMKAELAKKNLLPKRNSICVSDYMPATNYIYGSSPYGTSSYMGPDMSGNKYLYPTNSSYSNGNSMSSVGIGGYPTAPFHHRQSVQFSPTFESMMYSSSYHSATAATDDQFQSSPDTFDSTSQLSSGKFGTEPDMKEASSLAFGTSVPTFASNVPFSSHPHAHSHSHSHPHSRSHSLVDFKLLVDPLLDYTDYYGVSGSSSLASRSASNEANDDNDVNANHLFTFLDDEEHVEPASNPVEAAVDEKKKSSPPLKPLEPASRANELESILEVENDSPEEPTTHSPVSQPALATPHSALPALLNSSPPSAIKPPSRTDSSAIHSPPPSQLRNGANGSSGNVSTPSDFFLCDTPPPHVNGYTAPATHRASFSVQDSYSTIMAQHAGQKPLAFDPGIFHDELESLAMPHHHEHTDMMHMGALASALPQSSALASGMQASDMMSYGASMSVSGDSSYQCSKPGSPLPIEFLGYHHQQQQQQQHHHSHHQHSRDGTPQFPYSGGFGRVSSGSLPHIIPSYGGLASSTSAASSSQYGMNAAHTCQPSSAFPTGPAAPSPSPALKASSASMASPASSAIGLAPQQMQPPAPLFRNGPNGTLYPIGENPPCNTLYVGNLPMSASEDELRNLFSNCPGYKRLSFKTKPNGPMCFVEFEDVNCATHAMNELYGSMLSSSTKGGIRLSYSKNPLGVRPPGTLPKSMTNALMALHASGANGASMDPSMMVMYHGAPSHAHPYALSPPMNAMSHMASPTLAGAPPPASSHMMAMMMAQGSAGDYTHGNNAVYNPGLTMARNMSEPMIYAPIGGSSATRMHGLMAGGMAGSGSHSSTALPLHAFTAGNNAGPAAAIGGGSMHEEKRNSSASFLDMFLSSSTTAIPGGG